MEDVHPNVREHLSVPKTQFWGVALKEGEKVQVGFEDRELVITNAAMHSGTKACKVQVLTDTGHAIIASLTERVPHAKVWFRVKAGQQTTITSRHGCTDVVGYTVDDSEDIDPDNILPPIDLPVDKLL